MSAEPDNIPKSETPLFDEPKQVQAPPLSAVAMKATSIAQTIPQEKVGFPVAVIISIITALLPELIKCFIPANSAQARLYLANRYNPNIHNVAADPYRGYRPVTVKRVMKMAMQIAASGKRRLSEDAAREIALRVLDDIRTDDSEQAESVINEVL